MTPAAKKGKYDAKFKLQVIEFAERFSNRAAGTKFGLNESTIRGWRKVKKAATTTPPATPPPRGHATTAALGWHQQPQHQTPQVTAYCVPIPPGEQPVRAEPWPRDTSWCGGEPARALAAADASTHYRKCPAREPQASEPPSPARAAAAPAFLPCEYPHGYAPLVPHHAPFQQPPPAPAPSVKRVLLSGSDYGNGFPEVSVPFTVIAEKALRAICDQRGPAAPSPACASNREVFASFLGLTPNRLVDNVT
ncbi:hypothetical protein HPB52_007462 [Rhipicephalus sanguineus]|uniref:Brinker DNA-binding domain-containing protein n=1 Tax=Rhipicephalus sanguineus TaxID=34632 RepID=A0A9D4PLE3_RHISA|nr:hypothetical protein HPB52_007462 [Rhipicephalus sanguineus]